MLLLGSAEYAGPRHRDAIDGAVGDLDYETPSPPVELNFQEINPVLQWVSKVRQGYLASSLSECWHERPLWR